MRWWQSHDFLQKKFICIFVFLVKLPTWWAHKEVHYIALLVPVIWIFFVGVGKNIMEKVTDWNIFLPKDLNINMSKYVLFSSQTFFVEWSKNSHNNFRLNFLYSLWRQRCKVEVILQLIKSVDNIVFKRFFLIISGIYFFKEEQSDSKEETIIFEEDTIRFKRRKD